MKAKTSLSKDSAWWDILFFLGLCTFGIGVYFVAGWPSVIVYTGVLLILAALGGKR